MNQLEKNLHKKLNDGTISPERQKECREFIEAMLEISVDESLEFHKNNVVFSGMLILDFFRLPKTELHEKFRKLCTLHKQPAIREAEAWKENQIQNNMRNAEHDEKLSREDSKRYQIIRMIPLVTGTTVMIIGIPYQLNIQGKGYVTKFAYTEEISNHDYPNLFQKYQDNLQTFTY